MRRLLLVAATLFPLAPVLAQPPGPMPMQPPGQDDAAAGAAHRAEMGRDLAIVLGLKPAQQPALDAWLAATGPSGRGWRREDMGRDGQATTPERLQEKQARLAERQQRAEAGIAATKRFYASLDTHQQQVFDALERLRHEHGHGGHGPHDGRHGPRTPPPAG